MSDIFVSYEKSDLAVAQSLAQALSEHGWSVFWDRTISIGSTWRETIGTELDNARSVIVLWSMASTKSHWVLDEAEDAKGRGILIPISIQDIKPPMGFRNIQTGNLRGWGGETTDKAFQRLVVDLTKALGLPPRLGDPTPLSAPLKPPVAMKPGPAAETPEPPLSGWYLEFKVGGNWYDRVANEEYSISFRPTNNGKQTNLQVRQTSNNWTGAAWVEDEIFNFFVWLPEVTQFEGRLVQSSGGPSHSTLVGKYTTVGPRSWDVILHRSLTP